MLQPAELIVAVELPPLAVARRWGYRKVRDRVFFFNDPATTEIYTLSLRDALPISASRARSGSRWSRRLGRTTSPASSARCGDRKSPRLNSSHANISYAVFCLK